MALERFRSWIQAWTWTEEEVSWVLVLQIGLLSIVLGFFWVLFGAVWFTYSIRKYEAMTKFLETSRPVEQIRADTFEEMTKNRDFVGGLFRGDEDGLKSG